MYRKENNYCKFDVINMFKFSIICLSFISYLASVSSVDRTEKINFLVDFLGREKCSFKVLTYLDWDRGSVFNLSQTLGAKRYWHSLGHSAFKKCPDFDKLKFEEQSLTVVLDTNMNNLDLILKSAILNRLCVVPHTWIIFGADEEILKSNYFFPLNSKIFIVQTDNALQIKVKSIYKIKYDFNGYIEQFIAKWDSTRGFLEFNKLSISKNRTNLRKHDFRASYVITSNSTFQHMTDYREKHADALTKINYMLFEHLADYMNATHVKIFRYDWGFKMDPKLGFTTGMFGDLHNGRADMGGTTSFTPSERLVYLKYAVSTTSHTLRFVFRAPPLTYTSDLFILPFQKYVWYACTILFAVSCLAVHLVYKWEFSYANFKKKLDTNTPNFWDAFMTEVSAVTQIGACIENRSVSGKLVVFISFLSFMYVYTAYSARIVVILQSTSDSIKDVKALYESNIEMGVEDLPYNKYYFTRPNNRSNEHWRKILYEEKIAPKGKQQQNFFTAEEGIFKVRDRFFAFHVITTSSNALIEKHFTETQRCAIRYAPTIFSVERQYLSLPRNSSYEKIILIGFRKLFEYGIYNREDRLLVARTPKCEGIHSSFVNVGLKEVSTAFSIFGGGLAFALLILLIEVMTRKYDQTFAT